MMTSTSALMVSQISRGNDHALEDHLFGPHHERGRQDTADRHGVHSP